MCGRYASFRDNQALRDAFQIDFVSEAAEEVGPGYNIAPTQFGRIVVDSLRDSSSSQPQRRLEVAKWGLIPIWAKDPAIGSKMFNARIETVDTKRSFAPSLKKKRCLVVADGYYEWRKDGAKARTPLYIHPSDGSAIAFAALYSWWKKPAEAPGEGETWLASTTIITRAAREELASIHPREPVILDHGVIDDWLDPTLEDPLAAKAIAAESFVTLDWHEVSRAVGNVANQGPTLIDAV